MDPRSFLTVLLAATASSCGGGGDSEPLSALLITLDTTRYDALGCTGGPPGVSPNLDALAAEGVLYEQARTVCPLTMPAHASIFTGLYPLRHTVHMNSMLALPSSAHTLAERASQRGFQTAAFIAAVVLADDFGLAQGFERYDQPAPPLVQQEVHYDRRPANEVADAAIAWLEERDPERPFLLWAHFFDPHVPHDPPEEFLRAGKGDPYLGAVAFMDHHIGRILAALDEEGLLDETIVVVVADHGEARGDHGESTHGVLAYDSTIRVPLIVRHPDGWRAGERSDEIVSVADVFPTLVEALELGGPGDVDGVSLHRRRAPPERGVYYESYYGFFSYGWSPLAGWADARGRYLHSSAPEYYALTDEEERVDLIAEQDELERYRRAIDSIAGRSRLTRDADDTAAAHVLAQLQRLGYTGAAAGADGIPSPLEETGLPSPRDRQPEHLAFLNAQALFNEGQAVEGIPVLERLVAENPRNVSAWFLLGSALILAEEYEESIRASKSALEHGIEWYGPHRNLGTAYQRMKRWEEALKHYDRALELEPTLLDIVGPAITCCQKLGYEDRIPRYRVLQIQARETSGR